MSRQRDAAREAIRAGRAVVVANASGFNMTFLGFFGVGPRWDLECGNCHRIWSERLPEQDYPTFLCPGCGVSNVLPVEISFD